jgi:hypothetical protein
MMTDRRRDRKDQRVGMMCSRLESDPRAEMIRSPEKDQRAEMTMIRDLVRGLRAEMMSLHSLVNDLGVETTNLRE